MLVVDDTAHIHDDFRKILVPPVTPVQASETALFPRDPAVLRHVEFEVDSAFQGREALACVQRAESELRPYSVAFVDMRMPPGWDGIETIRQIWAVDPNIQVVICTAHSDYSWDETVRHLGESDNWVILKKPFDNIEVLQLAHALAKKWLLTRRDRERLEELGQTVRKRTIALRDSEIRFVHAFHANPIAVTLQTTSDGRYLDVNAPFCRLVGMPRESILGLAPADLDTWTGKKLWQEVLASVESRQPLRSHRTEIHTAGGDARQVRVSVDRTRIDAEPCVLTSYEDITEWLHLEEQLRQAQKMEVVGQLAAGIAHDFNNMLTVIQGYSCLGLQDAALPAAHRKALLQIRTAADQANGLTRQLLVFSRRQITNPKPVHVATSISGLRDMLSRLLPAHVELVWNCDPTSPRVHADEANLTQVIMNLVVNASDALPEKDGRITLGVQAMDLDAAGASRHPDARPGRFVCVSVRDNGAGIPPEVLPRIFEPFFTTKAPGHGTGLGLSTVNGIVRQHEGWIEVTSSPGDGTLFEIFLPTLAESPPNAVVSGMNSANSGANHGCGEHILLVEDDATLRESARMIATRCGYQVTEAVDGPTALRLWAAAPEPFDMLLTDLVMPNGMNGVELAAELRRRDPRLKVVLTTGYSQKLLDDGARQLEAVTMLLKPYSVPMMLATLREALNAPVPAAA